MPSSKEDNGKQGRPAVGAHTAGRERAGASTISDGWKKAKKASPAMTPPQPAPIETRNRFQMLMGEEEEGESEEDVERQAPPPSSRPRRGRTKKPAKGPPQEEIETTKKSEPMEIKLLERPHRSTWFLPGRVGRVPVQILMDTGCTTNLISKATFNKLDKATRDSMEPYEAFGTMANGDKLEFFGLLKAVLKIRHVTTEETFVVGHSDEDIILGMSFFVKHSCSLDFSRGTLKLGGKELTCTDREGRPMLYRVQVYKTVELPPGREVTVAGRVPREAAHLQGVTEGRSEKILIASSLNQPDAEGRILLRCLNVSDQPVELTAGVVVGEWLRIREEDIQEAEVWKQEEQWDASKGEPEMQPHLNQSSGETTEHCGKFLGGMPRCEAHECLYRSSGVIPEHWKKSPGGEPGCQMLGHLYQSSGATEHCGKFLGDVPRCQARECLYRSSGAISEHRGNSQAVDLGARCQGICISPQRKRLSTVENSWVVHPGVRHMSA